MVDEKKYFDLTTGDKNIFDLSIKVEDVFTCQLIDSNSNIYDGFILAKTPAGNNLTVCDINFHKSNADQKYQARLIFRKTDNDFKSRNVNKGNDSIIISFKTGQEGYRKFWEMIVFLYKWREIIDLGDYWDTFAVTEKSLLGVLPAIAKLENRDLVLNNLQKLSKDELLNIDNLVSIANIKSILDEWEENKNNYNEEFWQQKFQKHTWILSQIFVCPFIQIGKKFYCGGKEDDDKGGVKGDLLYKNSLTGNIAFIEIKTPENDIIIGDKYRGDDDGKENIIYSMNKKITGGVNQVLNQRKIYLNTHGDNNGKFLNNPKCILIIGVMPENEDEKKSFELYRNSLRDVEIITYDELFKKIESILNIFKK